jgi:hypothetical protein
MHCAGFLLPTVIKLHQHLSLYYLILDLAPFVCVRSHMVGHMPTDLAVRSWARPKRPIVHTVCAAAPSVEFKHKNVHGG